MFLSLTELEHHKIHFDSTYKPGEIALPDDLQQEQNLHAAGTAELLRNTLGEIRIKGQVQTAISAACDRCLEPARIEIDSPFELYYRPVPESNGHHERRINEGEADLSFYSGNGLELEEALREFVLLQVPMHHYCREDCMGICPVCGENRNQVACQCEQRPGDERWAALKNLAV